MALARLDKFRNAKGSLPTAKVRLDMQKTMQAHAAVFRTQKLMDEGIEHLNKVIDSFEDVAVSDRSMIWNSDLVETLEDRKSVVSGTSVSVRVDLGGRRHIKKKKILY